MAAFRPFNWECPYCNLPQAVTRNRFDENHVHISISDHKLYPAGVSISSIGCSNPECMNLTVDVVLTEDRSLDEWRPGKALLSHRLLPVGYSKHYPEFIPAALREDYLEACAIRDLSPKASATLSRRCLQGMIRDFCGITKRRLIDEISALRDAVNNGTAPHGIAPETVDAIDHVRSVGNIGAHMEADIDLIVPVEPGEAQLLIELIENLFEEWYIAREKRQDRFKAIALLAKEKQKLIDDGRAERKALAAPFIELASPGEGD